MPLLKRLIICGVIVAAAILLGTHALQSDLLGRALIAAQAFQLVLYRNLVDALGKIQEHGIAASWTMVGLSAAYGALHAVGPGHGKTVISTFLATHGSRLRRGLLLALAAAVTQGLTAVLLVEITVHLLTLSMRNAMQIETKVESVSFALIAIMGAVLVASSGWRLFARRSRHDHHHSHDIVCSSCGGSHAPTLHQLEQPVTWRSQAGIVLAIGIRPCSGAVLVLLAAQAFGMRSTGIAAVASMSLGTAATVAACALLSTYARTFSLRLAGSQTTGTGEIVGVIGGIVIMLFGAVLFAAGVSAPVYPLL